MEIHLRHSNAPIETLLKEVPGSIKLEVEEFKPDIITPYGGIEVIIAKDEKGHQYVFGIERDQPQHAKFFDLSSANGTQTIWKGTNNSTPIAYFTCDNYPDTKRTPPSSIILTRSTIETVAYKGTTEELKRKNIYL